MSQKDKGQVHGAMAAVELGEDSVGLPVAPHTLITVAEYLLPGIRFLATAPSDADAAPALAMLCAHTLECALKAYLSRSGPEVEKEIRNDQQLRHNLTALWERASPVLGRSARDCHTSRRTDGNGII